MIINPAGRAAIILLLSINQHALSDFKLLMNETQLVFSEQNTPFKIRPHYEQKQNRERHQNTLKMVLNIRNDIPPRQTNKRALTSSRKQRQIKLFTRITHQRWNLLKTFNFKRILGFFKQEINP